MRIILQSSAVAITAALIVAAAPAASAAPTEAASPPGAERPVQLALGDSWAAGAFDAEEGGYVNRLYDDLREPAGCDAIALTAPGQCKQLELRNISRGGATAASMITGQLPAAVALLRERNSDPLPWNDVALTTVTVGGNDVFGPVREACLGGPTLGCQQAVAAALAGFQGNLTQILGALRGAAGPDARIVVTAYDNPIPTCGLGSLGLGPLAALVLEGGPGLAAGLNDITRQVAAAFDVEVAETYGTLAPDQWVGGGDCLHPNAAGHEVVKDAFLAALAPASS